MTVLHRCCDDCVALCSVAKLEAVNKMPLGNLALVFGPTIMRAPAGLEQDMLDSGKQIQVLAAAIELAGLEIDHHFNRRHSYTPVTCAHTNQTRIALS